MEKSKIKAINDNNKTIIGKVVLVYSDCVASGSNEYTQITQLLVKEKGGKIHHVKPRNVIEIL